MILLFNVVLKKMEVGCTYGIEDEKCCVRFVMHSIEFGCMTEGEEDQLR